MSTFTDKAFIVWTWLKIQALYGADVTIWLYCFLRIQYLEWLNLSGYANIGGIRHIYYTYNGEQYLIPAPKARGPAKRFPELEEYFKNSPSNMVALMGPNNDWHGCGDRLMKLHSLDIPVRSSHDSIPRPASPTPMDVDTGPPESMTIEN